MSNSEQIKQQYLQNAANEIEAFVHIYFEQDKRKTVPKFFITINGVSKSPILDYDKMNYFLLGCITFKKHLHNH